MALTITLKARGKRRIIESPLPQLAPHVSSGSEPPHPTKRARRAETRPCPVCNEDIPLRLLAMHAQLESERVEEVVRRVGSLDVPYEDLADDPGPSSRARRSALKARKSMITTRIQDSLEQSSKTIQSVKRRRKRRNHKLKEMLKEEEGSNSRISWLRRFTGEEISCPVCNAVVRGDQDVLDAHVDACLAHESQRLEETRQREALHQRALEEENWENPDDNGGYVGDIRGAGFHRRADDECGVDEDVDIDGDEQVIFGEAQFTERDVVPVSRPQEDLDEDVEVEIEGDNDEAQEQHRTLRDLVAVGNAPQRWIPGQTDKSGTLRTDVNGMTETTKAELAILSARQHGDKSALVLALENKIKLMESTVSPYNPLLCRICIDPYTEPTVSTGCWHTCCKECWLRCLGSTKLCPICKRITGATDLRRIYL